MQTVTIVAPDRVGLMADISYILGKSRISINSIHAEVVGEKAIIAMSINDCKNAAEILHNNGFTVIAEPVVVKLPNVPGEIDRLANKLHDERIVIEDIHEVIRDNAEGVFALHVDKPRRALRVLNEITINPETVLF